MSFEDSSSQDSSSHRRTRTDHSRGPISHSEVGYLSSLIEPAQAPDYQQGAFPVPASSWPFNSPVLALGNQSQSAHTFPFLLHQQSSPISLNSSTSVPGTLLDSNTPRPGQSAHSGNSGNCREHLTAEQIHGLGITSYPMSVSSDAYLAGPMQPNSQHYPWANRPLQPLQQSSQQMNQQFVPSQPYHSPGFPVGYNGQPSGSTHSYHQESPAPPSYLPGAPGSARRNQSRSPLMARSFPPHATTGPLSDQPLRTSSPYMLNQPAYYPPEAGPIPSSHRSSMNSQASSMPTEPVYSPPDSIPPAEPDHQVRLVSSRPRPQCWDHGCNGREFSTFSNLLRHQREKSGVVAKAECPICGAVFTRTTARNIHVAQGKCKMAGRESSAE